MSWYINDIEEEIKTYGQDVLEKIVIKTDNYLLMTWGSVLQERFYDENGREKSRKCIDLIQACLKFANNEYLLSLKSEEDLPNYGDDFF